MKNVRLFHLMAKNAHRGSFKAEDNTLFLYDVIVGSDEEAAYFGGISPQAFSKALASMSGDIHLRINSPGGDVFGSRAMAQAMREYPGNIIAHVDGYAASAASLIAVSAKKCIMAPGSFLMIHNAWTIALGNSADFAQVAGLLAKIDGTLAETYATKGNKSIAEFGALMAAETWFTPQEALDCGLADELAPEAQQETTAALAWDLSSFAAAPKPAADDSAARLARADALIAAAAAETQARAAADAAAAAAAAEQATAEIEHQRRARALLLLETAA